MVNAAELRRVAAFSDLPDEQIDWFLGQAQEITPQAGEIFVHQGDPADWMFVFLEGVFQWRGEFGGDTVVLPVKAGDVSGVYPFSRMKQFTVTGRALTEGRLLRFPASLFPELVQKMPELTTSLVAMMSDRVTVEPNSNLCKPHGPPKPRDHMYGACSAWSWRIFARCASFRSSRNHHSQSRDLLDMHLSSGGPPERFSFQLKWKAVDELYIYGT